MKNYPTVDYVLCIIECAHVIKLLFLRPAEVKLIITHPKRNQIIEYDFVRDKIIRTTFSLAFNKIKL